MFIKPLSYYSASKGFLTKSWGHGKFMASKIDGILRQGMEIYGAVKPIAQEAASAYGGAKAKQALTNVDRNIMGAAKQYQGIKSQVSQAGSLVERLSGAIGGY